MPFFIAKSESLAPLRSRRGHVALRLAHLLQHLAQRVVFELGRVAGFVKAFAVVQQFPVGARLRRAARWV